MLIEYGFGLSPIFLLAQGFRMPPPLYRRSVVSLLEQSVGLSLVVLDLLELALLPVVSAGL